MLVSQQTVCNFRRIFSTGTTLLCRVLHSIFNGLGLPVWSVQFGLWLTWEEANENNGNQTVKLIQFGGRIQYLMRSDTTALHFLLFLLYSAPFEPVYLLYLTKLFDFSAHLLTAFYTLSISTCNSQVLQLTQYVNIQCILIKSVFIQQTVTIGQLYWW